MEDYYLVEAKKEYTGYLISTLTPSMYNGFKDIFEQSKRILNGNSVFKNFQILMSNVPNWNNYMLDKEVSDITKETGCDWLDNLITAVFVSHSKILTSVKVGNYRPRNKKIDLKIPDTTSFIHQCYVQAAREFYKNPMLFMDDTNIVRPDEILKNQSLAQSIIKYSILSTIIKLLPFRSILNEYLTLEGGNNTVMIGGPSTVSNIQQIQTIENTPSIPLPVISMPGVNSSIKLDNLITTIKEENNSKNDNNTSTSSSSEEKEKITKGRELNLEEFEEELEKSIDSIVPPSYTKKERSLDTLSVQKMVSNIKEEFNVQQKNSDSSIDLDDLSFLKDKKQEEHKDDKSISTLGNLDLEIDKSSKSTLVGGFEENKTIQTTNKIANSVDIQNLKDDGTLLNNTIPSNNFLLSSITPTVKERPSENLNDTQLKQKSPQIKKISIKYNVGMPIKKNYNSGLGKKKKVVLLNEAADSDSSEMIFK
jgi:hypothetical protein